MVLGEDQQCRTTKDYNPHSCKLGFMLCYDRKCVYHVKILRKFSFKKDNIYMGRWSCGCKPHCVLGLWTCPC